MDAPTPAPVCALVGTPPPSHHIGDGVSNRVVVVSDQTSSIKNAAGKIA